MIAISKFSKIWALGFALVSPLGHTQGDRFANCHQIRAEEQSARDHFTDDKTLQMTEQLTRDLVRLREEASKPKPAIPMAQLKNCLRSKTDTLSQVARKASGAARGSAAFNGSLGRFYESTGNNKSAFDHFSKASDRDPQSVEWAERAAKNLILSTQNSQKTNPDLAQSLGERQAFLAKYDVFHKRIVENDAAPNALRAQYIVERAEFLDRLKIPGFNPGLEYERALSLDPNHEAALLYVAQNPLLFQSSPRFRGHVERAWKLNPNNVQVFLALLKAKIDAKEHAEVVTLGREVSAAIQNNPSVLGLMAKSLLALGQQAESVKTARRALQLNKNEGTAKETLAKALSQEGQDFARQQKWSLALSKFNEALQLDPSNGNLRFNIAMLLYSESVSDGAGKSKAAKKDLEEAEKVLRPAAESAGASGETMDLYAQIADALSLRDARAALVCDRLQREFGNPTNPLVISACARNHARNGNLIKAQNLLQASMKNPALKVHQRAFSELLLELDSLKPNSNR